MSFTLRTLTEGIRDRHVGQQNKRLVEKWSRTGLLRGMDDVSRENMATLLENQAAQVLRESSTMQGGNVGGFTNIAFPIVRRVFGGLIANELVSIQPMSLPSGLLFYLDYTYGSDSGSHKSGESIYGGPVGRLIQEGSDAVGGQYDLVGSGFSKQYFKHGAANIADLCIAAHGGNLTISGVPDATGAFGADRANGHKVDVTNSEHLKLLQHDPQIIDRINNLSEGYSFYGIGLTLLKADAAAGALKGELDVEAFRSISLLSLTGAGALDSSIQEEGASVLNVKRLTQVGVLDTAGRFTPKNDPVDGDLSENSKAVVLLVVRNSTAGTAPADDAADVQMSVPLKDQLEMASTSGAGFGEVSAKEDMPFEGDASGSLVIPEIDIKIESIPVTAQTRKLRAKWSPELAQDLNAYHSMDAEVELTQILSEQIALEIDREILGDLLSGAKGANFFWSRSPGKFVNKRSGKEVARTSTLNPGPAFTGTVREWYETLTETVIDVANEIHRKTLRGSANFIVVSPDVATILEASVLYRPSYSLDGDGQVGAPFTMGAEKIGTLSNRFTVYKDPYFPRNKILVGYKGGSYLETGFVYAPYVPLIVTPTIFQPEDFTPRKGVMTRYGKKMVRADFYGTVTCLDMNVI